MPGKKNPAYVVEQRINTIEAMILEGRTTTRQIFPLVRAWGLSKRTIDRYVELAQARLLEGLEEDRRRVLARHIKSRYKERTRIKRKGHIQKVDDEGALVYDEDGKPVYEDRIDDRMLLAIDQDIAKLEGAYEMTLNVKGGLNNTNTNIDIPLTSEEGKRIASELGLLIEPEGVNNGNVRIE